MSKTIERALMTIVVSLLIIEYSGALLATTLREG